MIYITGVSSFVGRELVRFCDKVGIEVGGMDLFPHDPNRFDVGDVRKSESGDLIPEGVDAVIHLAAVSRDGDCKGRAHFCFDANVMGTLNVIEWCNKKKARQLIFASSEWVYGRFEINEVKDENSLINIQELSSEYALSKLVSEVNLRHQYRDGFCAVTILRFGIIYGPRDKNWSAVESLINSTAKREKISIGSRDTGRHFVHIHDIVRSITCSIGLKGFEVINIQADNLLSLGQVVDITSQLLNVSTQISESDPSNPNVRCISNQKAKTLLGWRPEVLPADGIRSVAVHLGLISNG